MNGEKHTIFSRIRINLCLENILKHFGRTFGWRASCRLRKTEKILLSEQTWTHPDSPPTVGVAECFWSGVFWSCRGRNERKRSLEKVPLTNFAWWNKSYQYIQYKLSGAVTATDIIFNKNCSQVYTHNHIKTNYTNDIWWFNVIQILIYAGG